MLRYTSLKMSVPESLKKQKCFRWADSGVQFKSELNYVRKKSLIFFRDEIFILKKNVGNFANFAISKISKIPNIFFQNKNFISKKKSMIFFLTSSTISELSNAPLHCLTLTIIGTARERLEN